MSRYILGISAYYHDSAATLLSDGFISSAVQEERFTRVKHDSAFPSNAIKYCLEENNIILKDLESIVFYDKPLVKFDRLLETYLSYAPKGIRSFAAAMPIWLKEKLYLKNTLKKELAALADCKISELPPLLFVEHHHSHAASAFYPSPFAEAVVLCLDGVGEWATTSVWLGKGNSLKPLWEIDFPHSLGLLYSAFTYYTGFKVNSGEYKLMGLAPYGQPVYVDLIYKNLIDLKDDGTFRLNMQYFNYCTGLTMTNKKFDQLFRGAPRQPESELTQREMDIAASIQVVTEEVVLRLANSIHQESGMDNLCLAGGVALNCVANGRILKEGPFKNMWIQPAAGDAGGSLGAATAIWYEHLDNSRKVNGSDSMRGSYLGPQYKDQEIEVYFKKQNAVFKKYDWAELYPVLASILAEDKVVGWFQGRMEFGPRALGGRSILGDPRSEKMQSIMKVFIIEILDTSVLSERVADYFDLEEDSPYMLIVARIKESLCIPMSEEQQHLFGIEKLNIKRSELPAITHVDYSARVQTVHNDTNHHYHNLIKAFEDKTNCGVLVNTSFNVRGEPIVCTPEDAYQCFMRTEMDYLAVENYLLAKTDQPSWQQDDSWKTEFELD